MPSFASIATGLLAALPLAAAHMEMSYPPPLRSKFNPHATNIDYSMTAPLSSDGSNYPCKGYLADLGTAAGASTATFAPGSTHNMTIVGGAAHGGGSCQASLSYDGGKTFTVIKSIVGGCPLSSSYDFTIPSDAQAGDAIFSWTWFNQLGNREMYQNCAPITIGGGSARRDIQERAAAFSSRPPMFLANIGNGCKTLESADVTFPNPGPDVLDNGGKQSAPSGSCGSAAPGGGSGSAPGGGSGGAPGSGSGSGSGNGNGNGSPAPTQPAAPAPPAPVPTTAVPPKPSVTRPGGIFITVPTAAEPTPTVVPTTLQTATKTTPAIVPTGTGSGSAPALPAPAAPAPAPGSGSGSGANTGACTSEGAWNCIGGTSFQRCASGQWSVVIPMAAGTKCSPGTSDTLSMSGRRVVRRFRGSSA